MRRWKVRVSRYLGEGEGGRDGLVVRVYLVGRKDHSLLCPYGVDVLLSEFQYASMCSCSVRLDSLKVRCPMCGREGHLYIKGGPTSTRRGKVLKAYTLGGRVDTLSIKEEFGCLGCYSRYSICDGEMGRVGELVLPQTTEEKFKSDLTGEQMEAFMQIESMMKDTMMGG